jgi:hypothetical protein
MKYSLLDRCLILVLSGINLVWGTNTLFDPGVASLLMIMVGGWLFGQWWMMAIYHTLYARNNPKEVLL